MHLLLLLCLQLRRRCRDQRGNQKVLLQSRSERSPGTRINIKIFTQPWGSGFRASTLRLLPVALREAARDPGAPDWRHTTGRSHHYVLHPQAGGCCAPLKRCPKTFYTSHCVVYRLHTSIHMSAPQKLDINWTGLTNLLDIPGLR